MYRVHIYHLFTNGTLAPYCLNSLASILKLISKLGQISHAQHACRSNFLELKVLKIDYFLLSGTVSRLTTDGNSPTSDYCFVLSIMSKPFFSSFCTMSVSFDIL